MSVTRKDLTAGYGQMGKLITAVQNPPINLATLPDFAIIVVDGIRLDATKVIELLETPESRHAIQACTHDKALASVIETALFGHRTILLEELAMDEKLYLGDACYDKLLVEHELMRYAHILQPTPTPVDLGSLPAETIILVDNHRVAAGKLCKLLIKAENTGQILPVARPKFEARVIDTAKDCGIDGQVSIEGLMASNVYWLNGQEYDGDDIERLIILNTRKLDPRSHLTRFTDSVDARWEALKANARGWYVKHPRLTRLGIIALTLFLMVDAVRMFSLPVTTVTSNLLAHLQDPTNGYNAVVAALNGVDMHTQIFMINAAFTLVGGFLGYFSTQSIPAKSRQDATLNALVGVFIGVLASRFVQFLVVTAFAAMLH